MNGTVERTWSPYQTAIFEFIETQRASLLVEAVAGCLSGDTVLGINRGGKSYQGTISYLTEMMNGGTRSGRQFAAHIPTRVRALGHKAKGLEWTRVFILDAELYMPSKWARQPWQRQQEANLQYVAATRAKERLVYITSLGVVETQKEEEEEG